MNIFSFGRIWVFLQVILLEESWAELFLLNAIQWCMPLDPSNCALFSVTEHCNNITANGISKQELALDIRTLHDTLCRFKSILVDPAEFACLKAIVLFRSETRGLKDPSPIENLQDQAQVRRYMPPGSIVDCFFFILLISLLPSIDSFTGDAVGTLSSSISSAKCTIRSTSVDVAAAANRQFTSH